MTTPATIPVPIGITYAVRLERLVRLSGGTATARGLIEQALDGMLGREHERRHRPRGGRGKGRRILTLFNRDPCCSECRKKTVPDAENPDDRPALTRDGQRLLCKACQRQHYFAAVSVRISRGQVQPDTFGAGLH
jgi:hypothetical protein